MVQSGKFTSAGVIVAFSAVLAILVPWPAHGRGRRPAADTVIVNARIYTVNAAATLGGSARHPRRQDLAVGSAKEIAAYRGPSTKVIDARASWSFPASPTATSTLWTARSVCTQVDLNGCEDGR